MKGDIATLEDIRSLVNEFYGKVRLNPKLGPIFSNVIGAHWEPHLAKMYSFWQTILLEEHTYSGRPFPPHAQLPVSEEHFQEWLRLWHETVDAHFEGEKALEAKKRAELMAALFMAKITHFRQSPRTFIQ